MPSVSIIGAGFSGLSAAACLAKAGFTVSVYEKNSTAGGRARKLESDGFRFDLGPSWYWMPEVFENYFKLFGKTTADFYTLKRLDPSYRIFFSNSDIMDVPAGVEALCELFEMREAGTGARLKKFLAEAKYKYETGMRMVFNPGTSARELLDAHVLGGIFKLDLFKSLSAHVRKYFNDPGLIQLMEFPVIFLGASPNKTPALYSMMNYADMALGTWYPSGGMFSVVEAMQKIAEGLGVAFHFNSEVNELSIAENRVKSIRVNTQDISTDFLVASADYHHVEQELLPKPFRRYTENYWNTRVLAPSSLIFYVGLSQRVKNLLHHNLFFDSDLDHHTKAIYEDPTWPARPQFYVSCSSKTDPAVAPDGGENLVILIPVAPGLQDTDEIREKYFEQVIVRIEGLISQPIREHIVFKKSYAHRDFITDYHAYRGNAYGLANTTFQTANFKPSILNKKVKNLFYTGQLTVPGPGVPPSIISGQVVARELAKRAGKK